MFEIFSVAGIVIEVQVIEVGDWNGPPHDELRTTFTAIVEGEEVVWSTSQVIPDYPTNREMRELFDRECANYAFLQRPKVKETNYLLCMMCLQHIAPAEYDQHVKDSHRD